MDDPIVAAGRYPFQAEGIEKIAKDVAAKLSLRPYHRLLEIGFGTGALLLPLAERVTEAVGIDQAAYVARVRSIVPANVSLVEGKFPETQPSGTFDRIVVYSTLHYLPSVSATHDFLDAAVRLLRPGGALLVGDLPNEDTRWRFLATPSGRRFEAEWRKLTLDQPNPEVERMRDVFADAKYPWKTNDDFVLGLLVRYRSLGLDAYVFPQDPSLPFGHSREDVLIRRR